MWPRGHEPYREVMIWRLRKPIDCPPAPAYDARKDRPMTLDLRIAASSNAEPLVAAEVRELVRADLEVLSTSNRGTTQKPLTRISERHHALAKLLAAGTAQVDAAFITGYTQTTISILTDDPSFKELVEFYRREVDAEYRGMHAQMAGLGADALDELRRRMEDEPDKMGASFLLDLVTKIADRTGHGVSTKTTQEVNVTVGLAERMKSARERARAASRPSQIELEAKDITP